jgi:hypothetical protein
MGSFGFAYGLLGQEQEELYLIAPIAVITIDIEVSR